MIDLRDSEAEVHAINEILRSYERTHAGSVGKCYRQNSGSIRIRIIDPGFRQTDKAQRHDQIWEILDRLDEEILSQITVLLLLTPEEVETSFANMDFDKPIPSCL